MVLSARAGWHTDELQRALAERGQESVELPYEALTARLGARGRGEGTSWLSSDGEPIGDNHQIVSRDVREFTVHRHEVLIGPFAFGIVGVRHVVRRRAGCQSCPPLGAGRCASARRS